MEAAQVEREVSNHYREICKLLGVDVESPDTKETPERVARSLMEQFASVNKHLTVSKHDAEGAIKLFQFDKGATDQIVAVKGISFYSVCAHHHLPFFGTVAVGYLPNKFIIGLSKIPRLVKFFAARPQVQEHLTADIAHAIQKHVKPKWVGVVVKARHLCVECRGVRQAEMETITSKMIPPLDSVLKKEFLSLLEVG